MFAVLLTGSAAHVAAQTTIVDKAVKYGEKYNCEITTVDEKNYTLELEWHSEASKISQLPAWQEKIIYNLELNSIVEIKGSFLDKGQNLNRAVLKFGFDAYQLSGVESVSNATGTNTFYLDVELSSAWVDNKQIVAVTKFKSSHWYEKYVSKLIKEVELAVKSSKCTISVADKL